MSTSEGVEWGFASGLPDASGSELQRRPAPEVGERFGGYELLAALGQGGMGAVYRARDAEGREFALKVLIGAMDERQCERFRREGELTAALAHPGIVRIHRAGEAGGRPYLVYELVEGHRTLALALEEQGRDELLALLVQVAHAVAHAHECGVAHRDLKPENVLVDADGRARVADFGLAWSKGLSRLTATGAMVGTPRYMAPEQFAGNAHGPAPDV